MDCRAQMDSWMSAHKHKQPNRRVHNQKVPAWLLAGAPHGQPERLPPGSCSFGAVLCSHAYTPPVRLCCAHGPLQEWRGHRRQGHCHKHHAGTAARPGAWPERAQRSSVSAHAAAREGGSMPDLVFQPVAQVSCVSLLARSGQWL